MPPKCRYKPGYDQKTRQYVGQKPRASRAKVKPTRTCPICALTYKANRSDQMFCSNLCGVRSHRGVIPKKVKAHAEHLIEKRRVARERAADKRLKEREVRDRRKEEQRIQDQLDAPIRAKWIERMTQDLTDQIKAEPQHAEELQKLLEVQLDRAQSGSIPPFARKMWGQQNE